MHKITVSLDEPKYLTRAVLQVIDLLGLYRAELARILGLQCADIAEMAVAKKYIEFDTHAWHQAKLFVQFYNLLYDKCSGDETMMCHWLRRDNKELGASPFYLIVDEHKLLTVMASMQMSESVFLNNKQARVTAL